MNRKLILKSPRFVPFGANLAQFESKSDIPGQHSASPGLLDRAKLEPDSLQTKTAEGIFKNIISVMLNKNTEA